MVHANFNLLDALLNYRIVRQINGCCVIFKECSWLNSRLVNSWDEMYPFIILSTKRRKLLCTVRGCYVLGFRGAQIYNILTLRSTKKVELLLVTKIAVVDFLVSLQPAKYESLYPVNYPSRRASCAHPLFYDRTRDA